MKAKLKKRFNIFIKHKGLRGGIIFSGLLIGVCWLLSLKFVMLFIKTYFTDSVAIHTSFLLNCIGLNVVPNGITLCGHGFSVEIRYGCNAIYEIMVFSSAIIASPIKIKEKLSGVIFGSLTIYLLNLVRVILLFISGDYFPKAFDILHENVSQNIFILCLVILWIFWVSRSSRTTHRK